MAGLFNVPPIIGHKPPKILNKELFPHPLGPEITTFIPLLITIYISYTNLSPLGVTIGKLSNSIKSSTSTTFP